MINKKELEEAILKYEHTPNIPFQELLDMRRVLAAQSYWYAKLLGSGLKSYRSNMAQRKVMRSKLIQKYAKTEKSNAAAKAKAEAQDEYMALLEAEEAAKGSVDAGYRLCSAIDNVLESMKQEIADLRKEKEGNRLQGELTP